MEAKKAGYDNNVQRGRKNVGVIFGLIAFGLLLCGIVLFAMTLTRFPSVIVIVLFFVLFVVADLAAVWLLAEALIGVQKPNRLGAAFAVILPIGLVAASTAKFVILGAPAAFADAALMPDLRLTLAPGQRLLLDVVVAAAILAFIANLRLTRPVTGAWVLLGVLAGVPVALLRFPAMGAYVEHWLPLRLSVFPLYGHVGNAVLVALENGALTHAALTTPASDAAQPLAVGVGLTPRNVHIVVVESLTDPLWFPAANWAEEPLSPIFARWRAEADSRALVPVFGNKSSNTEFEVLCGLPAVLGESTMVFNLIQASANLPCLPRLLRESGYGTIALVPNTGAFFNAANAFQAMGFEQTLFEPALDMSDLDGAWLSALSTLDQLARVTLEWRQRQPNRPTLTYAFVNAGHFPYERNLQRRPDLIHPQSADPAMHAWSNGAHYNALAIENYVARVLEGDSEALIVIIGDHNPALGGSFQGYRAGGRIPEALSEPLRSATMFETPLLVLDRGRFVRTGRLPAWQLPDLILDILSGATHCADRTCGHRSAVRLRPLPGGVITVAADGQGEHFCRFNDARAIAADRDRCSAAIQASLALRGALLRLLQ